MRATGRFVLRLVSRARQQVSTSSQRFEAHGCDAHHPGVQLSRRLFSSQAAAGGHQQRAIVRAIPDWQRFYSVRAIVVGVAASGCLGVLVGAAESGVFDPEPVPPFLHESNANQDGGESGVFEPEPVPPFHIQSNTNQDGGGKPRVVVLGTGWGGMSFLKGVDTDLYDVQVVSPRNYFVFTPLLPSVTNGTVEARSISEPVRRLCIKQGKAQIRFYEAECVEIDNEKKRLSCRDVSGLTISGKEDFKVDYDYLVIAVGALSNTFGTAGVEKYCHFLKELEDAERIRRSVVDCFETASFPHLTDEERKRMLSFVVVGGGPTGVEFAAELYDLVHEDLTSLYPHLQQFISVTIIQSGDHILNTFDERISQYAEKKFRRDGMKVQTNCRVMKVNDGDVVVKEKATGEEVRVPFGMAVWSTGLGTRPVISRLMQNVGQADRRMLATDEWLRVKGDHSIWAVGDCATVEQHAVMEDIENLFHKADSDNSGTISVKEFTDTMELVRESYPQIDLYMKRAHLKSLLEFVTSATAAGKQKEVELSLDQFKKALSKVDSQMKHLPATAQVAAQQGSYLAHCFNHLLKSDEAAEGPVRIGGEGYHRFHPFQYRHFGQFAPLGTEQCGAELPGDWVSVGRSTQWLWYSVYASKQVSWRTRALVLFDWTKRLFFGRDSSRL